MLIGGSFLRASVASIPCPAHQVSEVYRSSLLAAQPVHPPLSRRLVALAAELVRPAEPLVGRGRWAQTGPLVELGQQLVLAALLVGPGLLESGQQAEPMVGQQLVALPVGRELPHLVGQEQL